MKGIQGFQLAVLFVCGLLILWLVPSAWAGAWRPAQTTPYPGPELTPTPPVPTPAPVRASPTPRLTPASQPALIAWTFQPGDARGHAPTEADSALVLTFDRPVSLSSVRAGLSLSPATPGEFVALDERTVAFTPSRGWRPRTTYRLFLDSPLWPYSDSFYTPTAVAVTFPQGPRPAEPDDVIALSFGFPMDRASVEEALRIEPPALFRLEWPDDRTLSVAPQDAWQLGTTYTLTLGPGARTASGTALEAISWSFTTRSAVLHYGPMGYAAWYAPITLTFDRPVDHGSVEAALSTEPAVSGTFQWEENQLQFRPSVEWTAGATYRVVLAPSVRAADGTPLLGQPLQWEFTVRSGGADMTFGYGPNVQVLDAAGPRLIQFESWGDQDWVACTLYDLTPEQILSDYSSAFKGERDVETAGLPLARRWLVHAPEEELALPADLEPGIYVLAIGGGGQEEDALIVILTHYTLVLKEAGVGQGSSAEHQVMGWVSEIQSGQPRPGMTVRLYDRAGQLYAEGITDELGRVGTIVRGDTDPLLALGQVDGEWIVCGFGPEWQASGGGWYDWWGWRTTPPTGDRYRVYLYTDRPIYRPGQTVYLRAVIRADDDALYSLLPAGTPVIVRLRDARNNVLGTQELTTSEFGTVHTAFSLAEGGTLGVYHVEVDVGGEVTQQALKVEEYRTPDYEVTVSTDRQQYLESDVISVTVEARYYYGQPVVGAPVSLVVYKQAYDTWECGWENGECWLQIGGGRYSGITDEQGCWSVSVPAEEVQWSWWSPDLSTLSIEATIEDGSGQSVSSHSVVQVHRYGYGAALFLERFHFAPGEEIPLDILLRDYTGRPAGGVAATASLYAWNDSSSDYDRLLARVESTSDAAGWVHTALHVDAQGWFRLLVQGQGYPQAQAWVWVYDASSPAPWGGLPAGLQVSADRPSYAIGDVAQLLIRSPVQGTALLTLERGQVRRMEVIELTGPLTTILLPIEADLAPNVYVTVQIYRPREVPQGGRWNSIPDAELLMGSTGLRVPVPERRLQVTITPERDSYRPREEAQVTIQVTDVTGRPVRAELSLAMVDEAIYALSQDLSLDPFDAFYFYRSNLVRTYESLHPTRLLGGGAECGDGGGGMDVGNPRRYFPDTAYWNPAIVTDENGRAVVTLPLPDSLTRWRLVARAVTLDTLVGEGTAALTVSQSLVVQPALPRFLVQGDVLSVTASVRNYADAPFVGEAGLLVEGLTLGSPLTYSLGIASGETARVAWDAEVTWLGPVTVTAYARGPEDVDAVQYTLPVVPFAVPERTSFAGELVGEQLRQFSLPENYIPEVTEVEIRLAPSVVPALLEGLEYLTGYPFG